MPLSPRPRPTRTGRLRRALLTTAAAAAVAAGLAGCGSDDLATPRSASGDRVAVVATTSQLGDLVRAIGGDAVDVHQILQPSTDPHEYEPRPDDVAAATRARVVLASGLGLDDWSRDIVEQAGGDPAVVTVGESVPTKLDGDDVHAEDGHHEEEAHDHDHAGEFDPHWWHDPTNVVQAVGVIRDALVRARPAGAPAVRAGAARYLARVRALDAAIERCVAAIPAARRKLVTSHDAFGYFAHRYGLEVVGAAIPSQTTRAQASARQLDALVRVIRRERVRAIFPESSVNPDLSRAIARETGASADRTLYGDTLGEAGTPGATYLGMQRHNALAVVEGLAGERGRCVLPD